MRAQATEVAEHVGQLCAVATCDGVYGEIVRLSSARFLVFPRIVPADLPHAVSAAEITTIAPLPDPR